MMLFGKEFAIRTMALIVGALLVVFVLTFGVTQCQKRKNAAAQARTDAAQAGAASNSAADAINVVAASGEATAASEQLTRDNERDIRAADGANDKVKPGVNTAGLRALCQRRAYANEQRCARFRGESR